LRRRLRNRWPSCRSRASEFLVGALVALVLSAGGASLVAQQTGSGVIPIAAPFSGGGSFSGQLLAPNGSAAAPSLAQAANPSTGWYFTGTGASSTIRASINGTQTFALDSGGGVYLTTDAGALYWGVANDASIVRQAANWLRLGFNTSANRFDVSNTFTSGSNFEAFSIDAQTTANEWMIGSRTAATGTARATTFGAQASSAGNIFVGLRLLQTSASPIRLGYYNAAGTVLNHNTYTTFVTLGESVNIATTAGPFYNTAILPTYNQPSGAAANTDLFINRTETAVGSGLQRLIEGQTGGTTRFYVTAGGATGRGTQVGFTQAVAPTCSSNCGTSPSVAGSDTAMRVTMGSSGVPASGWVVTFNGTWAAAPICNVTMAKAGMVVGKQALTVVTTTTTITVVTNGTAPATTDIYSINCWGVP